MGFLLREIPVALISDFLVMRFGTTALDPTHRSRALVGRYMHERAASELALWDVLLASVNDDDPDAARMCLACLLARRNGRGECGTAEGMCWQLAVLAGDSDRPATRRWASDSHKARKGWLSKFEMDSAPRTSSCQRLTRTASTVKSGITLS